MLPEIIGLAKSEYVFLGNADLLIPNLKGFLIVFIDRGEQTILFQSNDLSQKLPAPGNGLGLEIIAKGEVTKHLKVSAVASSLTDVLYITGTNALLAGTYSAAGRLHLTLKIGLHGCHAGIDQKQGLIILRDQGKTG